MGNKHPRPLRPGEVPSGEGKTAPGEEGPGAQPVAAEGNTLPELPADSPVKKACLEDFELLKTVGKGSFGKVVQVRMGAGGQGDTSPERLDSLSPQVRKKDDGKIYAMKILKKEMILKRKQYEHTLSERRVLENIDHPFIVSLRFAFQSEHKLYMVFGECRALCVVRLEAFLHSSLPCARLLQRRRAVPLPV